MAEEEYEPLIVGFCCNYCAYAGADVAGTARIQYPPNIRIIRVMCSGMVHPNFVMEVLLKGGDGVLMCGCHEGDCHFVDGNVKAEQRAEAIRVMLEDLDIEEQRFRFERVSTSEGEKFARIVKDMVSDLKKLGPSIYKQ